MQSIDHRVSQKIRHTPLRAPRKSVAREGLFLEYWQQFAEQRPDEWKHIFRTLGPLRQRAASVAASFMVYMGCNCGMGFTHSAKKMLESGAFSNAEDAFMAAWAIENKRIHGVNCGMRTVEAMLAVEHPIEHQRGYGRVNHDKMPVISMDDMDVVESMVCWWSSTTAQWMREAVENRVQVIRAEEALQGNGLLHRTC